MRGTGFSPYIKPTPLLQIQNADRKVRVLCVCQSLAKPTKQLTAAFSSANIFAISAEVLQNAQFKSERGCRSGPGGSLQLELGEKMADKHPYANANGALIQVLDQFQKSFPAVVDADLMKKLGFAPNNESYIINVIRFLKLIDDDGKRTNEAQKVFTLHNPTSFKAAFAGFIKAAYSELFSLYKEDSWLLDESKLMTFFRQTDQSSELVGKRQTSTFRALAGYVGLGGQPAAQQKPKGPKRSEKGKGTTVKAAKAKVQKDTRDVAFEGEGESGVGVGTAKQMGLAVRIEVNLPAGGEQETYDRIFRSIRENLLNA